MKRNFDLAVLSLLFFIWGFVTCLNDILIPHLKAVFELNYFQAALVQFTFFLAYFVLALPSGLLAARFGYQKTLVIGLLVAAAGALGFLPAAQMVSYPIFLCALFAIASGITLLQVAANPYVLTIGSEERAASRLNLTQAFNALGTTVAPVIGGALILSHASGIDAVVVPYLVLSCILLGLAGFLYLYRFPVVAPVDDVVKPRSLLAIFRYRHTVLGAGAIFLYVGAEVSIGSFLINYLSAAREGISHQTAASYVSLYWGGAMVGRFLGSWLMRRISPHTLMAAFTLCAAALILLSIVTAGDLAVAAILAVGLFNSIMFPTIFAFGVAKLGPLTSAGSSVLVMAIVGGAILPVITGAIADAISLRVAFGLPLLCYLYLFYYSIWGSRVGVVEKGRL